MLEHQHGRRRRGPRESDAVEVVQRLVSAAFGIDFPSYTSWPSLSTVRNQAIVA